MKKILGLLLTVVMISSVISGIFTFGVTAVNATYTVEQWEMLEIPLTSTKEYSNSYLEAEINAVFTHESGTVISLPGFTKDGKKAWAVRFTPTKTGLWSYSVTCSDTENAGLFSSGTINVTPSSNKTALTTHGFVKHSPDNRYFVYDDGTPFFWLGDTQWQAPNYLNSQKCNYPGCTCGNQIRHEINDRKSKGFTIFQTYFSSGSSRGIWETFGTKPSYADFNTRIDEIFSYAYASDMVSVIGFGLHSSTPQSISEKLLNRFVKYIVARYACYSVVWMSGQEITNTSQSKTPDKTCMEVFMSASDTASKFDGYKHPSGAHMYPMSSVDPRAIALDEASWHNVWILQKGHGGTVGSKGFYKCYYNNPSGTVKPIIEGEANYEDINCGGFTGYNASRMCAWKALTNGCAGFTYGASGVWIDAYSLSSNACYGATTSYSYDLWYTGINKPASFEMTYLRRFFENLADWQSLVPRYSDRNYADFLGCDEKSLTSTDDMRTVVSYFYNSDRTTGTIRKLDNSLLYDVFWYDTLTGKYIQIESNKNFPYGVYSIPQKPSAGDWVLLITADNLRNKYLTETPFEDLGTGSITGSRIVPVSVSALGGVYTERSGITVDQTSALFDNDPSTVWTPLNQRTSQTFFCDLGSVQDLTNIVISPAEGTILPKLRVYASNDNKNWTILADNQLRENNLDANNNVSEKLKGGYRYLRIVLLSNTQFLSPAQAEEAEFKVFYNEQTNDHYSVTEIADIVLYSNGATSPVADIVVTPDANPKPTVSPSATALPDIEDPKYRSITNMNCESGTIDGWGVFSAGYIENVPGGANGSGHAIKYTPSSSQYSSVGFDLGPYIIDDIENGYNGYGAGAYKMSFLIKSATKDTGNFSVLINSQYHLNATNVRSLSEDFASYKIGTFFGTATDFTISDRWQRVECEFNISDEYISLIKQIYNDGNLMSYESSSSTKFNTDVYTLWLRLDGSGTERAYKNGTFPYLIDDLVIECVSPYALRKGVALTLQDTAKTDYVISNISGGYLNDVAIKNGTINKTVTVYNTSDVTLSVAASIQAETKKISTGKSVWAGPDTAKGSVVKIEPGGKSTFLLSVDVTDGIVQIESCQSKKLSDFFLRLDVTGIGSGNTIVVADADAPKSISESFTYGVTESNFVYSLPDDNTFIGDCDGDGAVSPADRILLSRYLSKWDNSLYIKMPYADINKDGKINTVDRIILSRYLADWNGYDKYFK